MSVSVQSPKKPSKPTASDRPLGAGQLGVLVFCMMALLLGFYLMACVTLAFIGSLMLFDVTLFICLARLGLSRMMVPPLQGLARLVELICRCLNLRPPVLFYLPLRQEQVPQLFECVARIAQQVGVKPPDEIVLEMHDNAWVRLRGYRTGAGRSTLCLGYDLLALLDQNELEAVIAHEMAHAKLIQRGFKGWLGNGIRRIEQQIVALQAMNSSARSEKQRFYTAEILQFFVSMLGLGVNKLFAAYCRHDEFLADKIAAEICGADTCARVIIDTHVSSLKMAGVTWRDRLVQIQRPDSFVEWIRRQGMAADDAERSRLETLAFSDTELDPHSTHPALSDRIAALPVTNTRAAYSPPAIALVENPEQIARDVIAAFERVAREQERRESVQLRKWVRKEYRRTKTTVGELFGWILGLLGALFVFMAIANLAGTIRDGGNIGEAVLYLVGAVATVAFSIWLVRVSIQRERTLLPVPSFERWQQTFDNPTGRAEERPLPLSFSVEGIRGKRALGQYWAEQCYQSLEDCHYSQANEAAIGCLRAKPSRLEGHLGRAITAAYYLDQQIVQISLGVAIENYGAGPSVSWGMAWVMLLLGDFAGAEPYLQDAVAHRPGESTLWALLAQCQSDQEKYREALDSAREAVRLSPDETALRELLLGLLLDFGQIRDAQTELRVLQARDSRSLAVQTAAVRLALLLGDRDEATRQVTILEETHPKEEALLHIAALYREAKDDEMMYQYFEKLNEVAFYPVVVIALANRELERKHLDAARALYFSAISQKRGLVNGVSDMQDVWTEVLASVLLTRESIAGCRSWKAILNSAQAPALGLGTFEFEIKATARMDAENFVLEFYDALSPGADVPKVEITEIAMNSRDEPTVPGIHGYRLV